MSLEVAKGDLDRVRTCIIDGHIESTILDKICIRHRSIVEKKSHSSTSSVQGSVDANATRIIKREDIILKNNIKPIRSVTLIFTLVESI